MSINIDPRLYDPDILANHQPTTKVLSERERIAKVREKLELLRTNSERAERQKYELEMLKDFCASCDYASVSRGWCAHPVI